MGCEWYSMNQCKGIVASNLTEDACKIIKAKEWCISLEHNMMVQPVIRWKQLYPYVPILSSIPENVYIPM